MPQPVALPDGFPDKTVLGTPLWWLDRLEKKLLGQQSELRIFDDYYEGRHKLAFATDRFKKAFGGLFDGFSDNWCDLVVDAVEERLNVEGFRFPLEGSGRERPPSLLARRAGIQQVTTGDAEAWEIWQANRMDAESQVAHTETLIHGRGAAMVAPRGPRDRYPRITVESAMQVFVECDPGYVGRRRAALKRWLDEDGYMQATLYLPDRIWKFQSDRTFSTTEQSYYRNGPEPIGEPTSQINWRRRVLPTEDWPATNVLEVVPVVPLENRPRLLRPGRSEIARVISLQDAVNKELADMLVASEFQAFRQRHATGLQVETDPETGQVLENFKAAIEKLWTSPSDKTTFGEFSAADLSNFVTAIEMLVQHIASQTRTPPHYFYLRGEFPSGESLRSAETGLVAKAHRKMRHFGESWEEVMRLAFLANGDTAKAAIVGAETIWADPESQSEAAHADALLKLQQMGVPDEFLWELWGLTPQQIARIQALKAAAPEPPVDDTPTPDPAAIAAAAGA